MRKLIFLLALIPFIVNGQTPTALVDISKYHDDNRKDEMIDNNFTDITTGDYLVPVLFVDSISTNGMYYNDTYWDDLRVPLTNTRINPAQSEPDFDDTGDGIFAWGFEVTNDSVASLHFIAQLPHGYKIGTDLDTHIHWMPSSTNTGDVIWKVFYKIAAINGTFSAIDSFRVADAADGTILKHQLTDLGDIDGSGLGISSMIIGNITRLGDATDDTFTGTVYGLEIDFHYQISSPGSEEEYVKY